MVIAYMHVTLQVVLSQVERVNWFKVRYCSGVAGFRISYDYQIAVHAERDETQVRILQRPIAYMSMDSVHSIFRCLQDVLLVSVIMSLCN